MERQAETRGIRHTQADSARGVGEAAATGSGLWPLLRDAQSIQKSLRSQARDGNYLGLLNQSTTNYLGTASGKSRLSDSQKRLPNLI